MSRKTILITGASRGIGRAAAIQAGGRGWSVAVNYVGNRDAAQDVVEAVKAAGGEAIAIQGDVAVEADVLGMFEEAARLGPLDGVVVNAGIVAPPQPLVDMSVERLRRMFDVNVLGAYLCAREAARRLVRSRGGKGGSIVLISSVAASLGSPGEYVDYAGSKGAVDTLTKGLAKELGAEGVRVNAVRPGLIDTDIHASGLQPDRAWRLGVNAPLGRPGTADEVAEAILWLLSDASSYASGTLLDVSGGR
ncbi:SDR family oxidoreductase [Robbsia sp. Bb-Pol-6]|uniref:SDR family oxidoreductase n=1 Tax=Robbsia betulipollinis TaxID=2981849 RepID=A0ABT3ZT28_9BURK|nr:SDR family oxidoreductase [Robbsia betulipollinis]MCY0389719.1 SDR family oxidoreductase [Robbsia betulipollinis]